MNELNLIEVVQAEEGQLEMRAEGYIDEEVIRNNITPEIAEQISPKEIKALSQEEEAQNST